MKTRRGLEGNPRLFTNARLRSRWREIRTVIWHSGLTIVRLTSTAIRPALLARQGLTNRQIASELSISEHTEATHIARIMKKLGLHSRAQITAWVTEGTFADWAWQQFGDEKSLGEDICDCLHPEDEPVYDPLESTDDDPFDDLEPCP